MEYLRQQIEASLGRSEELIMSDKARRNYYRYPHLEGAPLSPKKSAKERGTFNSVRLKKYLGLGSKRKQKAADLNEEIEQQLQQRAYLEELQRYGPVPTVAPPYYNNSNNGRNRGPPPHPHYGGEPTWRRYESGTVGAAGSCHYPNIYSSVNVRPVPRQRGSLQSAIYAWEPYLQPTNVAILTEVAPHPCTCEQQAPVHFKSKKHRSRCTCDGPEAPPGGPRSQRSKPTSRPSLFHGADVVCGHRSRTEAKPEPEARSTKSRLHRLSDVSTMAMELNGGGTCRENENFKRRSILECPVNPYELIAKERQMQRRSAPGRIQRASDGFGGDAHEEPDGRGKRKSAPKNVPRGPNGTYKGYPKGLNPEEEWVEDDDVADISLGGQRIRLFGTVRGTLTPQNSHQRAPIPTFAPVKSPPPPVPARHLNSKPRNGTPIQFQSFGKNKMAVEEPDDKNRPDARQAFEKPARASFGVQSASGEKHKTTITIGASTTKIVTVEDHPPPPEAESEPEEETVSQTVIAVGQPCPTPPPVQAPSASRLNLKINFNDLPAYLKPILKKASESSSEADSSDTYVASSGNGTVDLRQKQKKHVHFLSNRTSTNSDLDVDQSLTSGEGDSPASPDLRVSMENSYMADSSEDLDSLEDLYHDGISVSSESPDNERVPAPVSEDRWLQPANAVNVPDRDGRTMSSSESLEEDSPMDSGSLGRAAARRRNRSAASREQRKSNLRRSQSERQVAPVVDHSDAGSELRTRPIPSRSNSFQVLASASVSQQVLTKLTSFISPNNLNSPSETSKKYGCKDVSQQQQQQSPVYANESRRWNNDRTPKVTSGGPPLDIAKLRSTPKFLPRPTFNGKHLCSLHMDKKRPETLRSESSGSGNASSRWTSEDELYTDGMSTPEHKVTECNDYNKPLPPIPVEDPSEEDDDPNRNSLDYSSDDLYEQIGEPVYEEVPDTVSYSSGGSLGHPRKSIFEGASRTEILSYLEDAKERGVENIGANDDRDNDNDQESLPEETEEEIEAEKLGTKRHHRNRISNVSNLSDSSNTSEESYQNEDQKEVQENFQDRVHSSAEVERNDSGVGSETSKPSRLRRQSRVNSNSEQVCIDCDQTLDTLWDNSELSRAHLDPLVCRKCSKKRNERKEIILEFVETEIKYGRDLKIIKEEFHRPMLVAGLLSEELLNNIFLNLEQLIQVNEIFAEKLRDALDIAAEQGDEDYSTVNMGKVVLEASAMLHAFEAYCVRQGTASLLLTNLEKDKELLRIFLKVSQMENTLLRRLNLNSFLMVPVQRITKYPLLLNRLYKVTPHHHQDRETLREAQSKIELHLEHINQQAKDLSGMNLWRRISNISNSQRRNLLEPVIGNIKLRKMALEILQWSSEEVRFPMEGRLHYTLLNDHMWNKREKTMKLQPVHGLLITLGNPNSNYRPDLADRDFIFPRNTGIKEATLVLIKEKNSRFNLLRDPLQLQRCVISSESDSEDIFEVQEFMSKDSYLLKAEDPKDTQEWLKMLRYHAKDLGAWRRRRNALANIMINGMVARKEWL